MAFTCSVPFAALTPVRVSHRAGELVCEEVATVMCSLLAFYKAQGEHWFLQLESCNSRTGTPHCTVGILKLHDISLGRG